MKIIHTSGKRKSAVARATLYDKGKGVVRINSMLLDTVQPELVRTFISEPLILAGDVAKKVDIDVNVRGGGFMARAEAIRLAIARALAKYSKKLEKVFLNYDRHLLVADVRRKEPHKPGNSKSARAKRQKSYR
ncbi:30S ribosomal protein S9 [Candidatus Woesearchaeota archaeon]|nr:30S ribosomal protein S9 [Candidatus Woesearchaeota archaeon]RLE40360.1 MAG: 30S ribosomal protein S9 [Candidatus Woesearchaeota archaeon]